MAEGPFELANLVRMSSGALLVLLGAMLLAVGWRSPRPRAWGTFLVCFGPEFVFNNLTLYLAPEVHAWGDAAAAVTDAGALTALAFLLVEEGRPIARRARAWLGLGLGSGLLAAAIVLVVQPDADLHASSFARIAFLAYYAVFTVTIALAGAFVGVLADRARLCAEAEGSRAVAVLAAGFVAYPLVYLNGYASLPHPGWMAVGLAAAVPFVAATVSWGRARAGPAPRAAGRVVAFVSIVTVIAAIAGSSPVDLGAYGVARLLGIGILAYGVFRLDALGLGFRAPLARRATTASLSLAALLIVAQVAQNFLSAEFGILMGGIVAGAFLFAAQPIQRALEGRAPVAAPTGGDDRLEVYRDAARRSLREGKVTREDDMHLAKLARHLVIAPDDALRIRHEVEDERSVR